MAYGTEQIDRVQKVVGPGNKWVTAAKAEVQGDVAIDFLAGTSELLVLADESADPSFVAATSSHRRNTTRRLRRRGDRRRGDGRSRRGGSRETGGEREREDIRAALDNDASGVFLARSMSEAVLFAEEYAAEHLTIQAATTRTSSPASQRWKCLPRPLHARRGGRLRLRDEPRPADERRAKLSGGLSVDTFLRSTTVQRLDEDALDSLSETITTLAEAEGLDAHAESVRKRFEK